MRDARLAFGILLAQAHDARLAFGILLARIRDARLAPSILFAKRVTCVYSGKFFSATRLHASAARILFP